MTSASNQQLLCQALLLPESGLPPPRFNDREVIGSLLVSLILNRGEHEPGVARISKALDIPRTAVSIVLADLVRAGFFTATPQPGRPTRYDINLPRFEAIIAASRAAVERWQSCTFLVVEGDGFRECPPPWRRRP